MLLYLLSFPAKLLLWILGWHPPQPLWEEIRTKHSKLMVVFTHDTYADMVIAVIYQIAYPDHSRHMKILAMPQLFKFRVTSSILTYLGYIASTKREEKGGKGVPRIVQDLNQSDQYLFAVSPKGTVRDVPWSTGYYHIAKQAKLPIAVGGMDYNYHRPMLLQPLTVNVIDTMTEPEVQAALKEKMKYITTTWCHRNVFIDFGTRLFPNLYAILIVVTSLLTLYMMKFL